MQPGWQRQPGRTPRVLSCPASPRFERLRSKGRTEGPPRRTVDQPPSPASAARVSVGRSFGAPAVAERAAVCVRCTGCWPGRPGNSGRSSRRPAMQPAPARPAKHVVWFPASARGAFQRAEDRVVARAVGRAGGQRRRAHRLEAIPLRAARHDGGRAGIKRDARGRIGARVLGRAGIGRRAGVGRRRCVLGSSSSRPTMSYIRFPLLRRPRSRPPQNQSNTKKRA